MENMQYCIIVFSIVGLEASVQIYATKSETTRETMRSFQGH